MRKVENFCICTSGLPRRPRPHWYTCLGRPTLGPRPTTSRLGHTWPIPGLKVIQVVKSDTKILPKLAYPIFIPDKTIKLRFGPYLILPIPMRKLCKMR